jgi:hypothetical protein
MPTLLRLTTEDNETVFNSIFKDELVIKKDSKMALQNVALQTASRDFVIDDNNKTIFYQNSTSGVIIVELTESGYNDTNFQDLFTDIQDRLNESTIYDYVLDNARVLGVEWSCGIPSGSTKVLTEYKRGSLIRDDRNSSLNTIQAEPGAGFGRQYFISDGVAGNAGFNYNRLNKKFVARGCSYTRAKVDALNNPSGFGEALNGMILCLTSKDLTDAEADDIVEGDIKYGIWATIDAGGTRKYYYYVNGVKTLSAIAPSYNGDGDPTNDELEILINGGNVLMNVIRANGTRELLQAESYTAGQRLWAMEIWHGGDNAYPGTLNASFADIAYIESPYDTYNVSSGLGAVLDVPDTSPYDNFLEFDSDDLSEYLGYARRRQPATGFIFVSEASYPADFSFTPFERHDAFIVLIDSIPLNSYDAFKGGRKNILAIIPKSDQNGELIYEPNNINYVSINNDTDINLRNIRARIVRSNYEPLKTRGLTSLTIFIE